MKSIVRFTILLVVCVLVGVGVYAAVETNPQLFGLTEGSGGLEGRGERPALTDIAPGDGEGGMERPASGERPGGEGFERGGRGAPGGVQAWTGVARNLGVIGLITLGVWLVQKAVALVQRRVRRRPPAITASAG